ncbi:hypothetical protein B0T21DRAFT_160089 [Apiosordaria backusii]|uniref:Uncharacterized protein n=1 Tax=Apiosordaria backusii TaxID=314023 RepID=A0AA40EGT8_9PEZI|nr:hypothetical protein B0T21DRAFT_160089 [Apiosordaria backusii]
MMSPEKEEHYLAWFVPGLVVMVDIILVRYVPVHFYSSDSELFCHLRGSALLNTTYYTPISSALYIYPHISSPHSPVLRDFLIPVSMHAMVLPMGFSFHPSFRAYLLRRDKNQAVCVWVVFDVCINIHSAHDQGKVDRSIRHLDTHLTGSFSFRRAVGSLPRLHVVTIHVVYTRPHHSRWKSSQWVMWRS